MFWLIVLPEKCSGLSAIPELQIQELHYFQSTRKEWRISSNSCFKTGGSLTLPCHLWSIFLCHSQSFVHILSFFFPYLYPLREQSRLFWRTLVSLDGGHFFVYSYGYLNHEWEQFPPWQHLCSFYPSAGCQGWHLPSYSQFKVFHSPASQLASLQPSSVCPRHSVIFI